MNELTLADLDMGTCLPHVLSTSKPTLDSRGTWHWRCSIENYIFHVDAVVAETLTCFSLVLFYTKFCLEGSPNRFPSSLAVSSDQILICVTSEFVVPAPKAFHCLLPKSKQKGLTTLLASSLTDNNMSVLSAVCVKCSLQQKKARPAQTDERH